MSNEGNIEQLQTFLGVEKQHASDDEIVFNPMHHAVSVGHSTHIAYGGFTLGILVAGACQTVSERYNLYSFQGVYMGPVLLQGPMQIIVRPLRDTKSFATRLVTLRQIQGSSKKERDTFVAIVDFHVREPDVFLYSTPPKKDWPGPEQLPDFQRDLWERVQRRDLDQSSYQTYLEGYTDFEKFFDIRYCPQGVQYQNVNGIANDIPTGQDHLPITSRYSARWVKTREKIDSADRWIHRSILAFIADMALAHLPPINSGRPLSDFSAISSLDTSLRFHHNDFRVDEFMLIEFVTEGAAQGRAYSMNRIWRRDGQLIASNNQCSIIREAPQVASRL